MTQRYLLARLGGARVDTVATSAADRQFSVAMASIMLITATVGGISLWFGLTTALHLNGWVALPIALAWLVAIYVIDRTFTMQLVKQDRWYKNVLMAVPRLLFAAVIGVIVSTPVTLEVFAPEIETQLLVMQGEARDAYNEQLEKDPVLATEDDLRATIAEKQAILEQTQPDPTTDPAYAAAKAASDAAAIEAKAASDAVVAESNGTGGSGIIGVGPRVQIAQQANEIAQAKYAALQQKTDEALAAAQGNLAGSLVTAQAQAEIDVADARDDLEVVLDRKEQLQAENDAAVASSDGFLNRLTALERLGASSPSAATAHWLLFGFFFLLEILPVSIKLLRLWFNRSVVDEAGRMQDDATLEIARLESQSRIDEAAATATLHRRGLDARIAVGTDREEHRERAGLLRNEMADRDAQPRPAASTPAEIEGIRTP
ncbi:hypothetical protein HD599_000383 [Conyzicola lurida]|uniref:DUF4407 domain-containing protein n=1 Tax=Conyzicola lurida TaxID=1172621 RepID=A0A841AEA2_9MICO|nr:DUF4407 domain-containing protein [Conyzicola lurida]MBB5842060.1 hypothetical protein [Conyzicola lurida]